MNTAADVHVPARQVHRDRVATTGALIDHPSRVRTAIVIALIATPIAAIALSAVAVLIAAIAMANGA